MSGSTRKQLVGGTSQFTDLLGTLIATAMPRPVGLILATLSSKCGIVHHSCWRLAECLRGTFASKAGSWCLRLGTAFVYWTSLAAHLLGAVQNMDSAEKEVPRKRRRGGKKLFL